jgi:hypothetical protein
MEKPKQIVSEMYEKRDQIELNYSKGEELRTLDIMFSAKGGYKKWLGNR